jgi:uncharacterized metal-binding protein YceD (DUF177 family)
MNWLRQCIWLFLAADIITAFYLVPRKRLSSPSCCYLSTADSSQCNEFSRPLETDKILKTASGNKRRTRDYTLDIVANEKECEALAKRFELKRLQALEAELSVRPSEAHQNSKSRGLMTVYVEGTISASLTQTCVRTNDDFPVNVEFTFQSIVKPTANNFVLEENGEDRKSKKATKDKHLKGIQLQNLNDIVELQNILDDIEGEYDDLLVEDESIYSLLTGTLDVGELVAQSFWLNLDPYPKKPGSGPIEISISG